MLKLVISCLLIVTSAFGAETTSQAQKRKEVAILFQKAVEAFTNRSYQRAIATAEQIRHIALHGDTHYLNEAKQIIDRSRMLQKEEFEPFLLQAREKYDSGDFTGSYEMCAEMLRVDAAYEEARECIRRAQRGMKQVARTPMGTLQPRGVIP